MCGECEMTFDLANALTGHYDLDEVEEHMEIEHEKVPNAKEFEKLTRQYDKVKEKYENKIKEYNNLWKTHIEINSQLYEVQGQVTDLEETVSDITGVNVVIAESLKVQQGQIQHLQEELEVLEASHDDQEV